MPIRSMKFPAIALMAITLGGCMHAGIDRPVTACSLKELPGHARLVHVPFEVVDGRVYVNANVNGKGPFRFAVDTGASGDARVDMKLARDLKLPVSGEGTSSDGIQSAEVTKVLIESISLGGLSKRNLEVTARDYSARTSADFSGILARGFFADGLLVLDFPNKTLAFSNLRSIPEDAKGAIKYQKPFRIPVEVGKREVVGNLDTGADVSFVIPTSLYSRIQATPLIEAGRASLTNTKIDMKSTKVLDPIRIGSETFVGAEARVIDNFPELLVGSHILSKYIVLVDQRTKALALCE